MVIVRNGRLQRQLMHQERLTEEDVKEAAREQGIGDLHDVVVGILEADGTFSFIKRIEVDQQRQGQEEQPAI